VRSPPPDQDQLRLRDALAEGWGVVAVSLEYLPEGGGSHHWVVIGDDGQRHFLTVDDLDNKSWFGDDRNVVLEGLGRALDTASALRHEAGLEFVVSPIAGTDGRLVRRFDSQYTLSVFPFLAGRSFAFGPYADAGTRDQAVDLIVSLHAATASVRGRAPGHVPRYGGEHALKAFLAEPDTPWTGGPFSASARDVLTRHTREISKLADGFDRLVAVTAPQRADLVVTHGEPHPANLVALEDGRLALVDWDTVALAPPERDLSLMTHPTDEGLRRYARATGRPIHASVIALYRLPWYLDDLASAARLFRNEHRDTPDTRRWLESLAPRLTELPVWLALLDRALHEPDS
jgi:spectinomycin phosphotransferase